MITVRVWPLAADGREALCSHVETIPLDTPMVLYSKTFLPGWSFEILSVEYK